MQAGYTSKYSFMESQSGKQQKFTNNKPSKHILFQDLDDGPRLRRLYFLADPSEVPFSRYFRVVNFICAVGLSSILIASSDPCARPDRKRAAWARDLGFGA